MMLERPPSLEELAQRLHMPEQTVWQLCETMNATTSPVQLGADEEEMTLEETLVDEDAPSPADEVLRRADRQRIRDLLAQMEAQEAEIIRLGFGLGDQPPMSRPQISAATGLSGERVRQLESRGLQTLRRLLGGRRL